MGFPLDVAVRYMGSKKRAFISVGTMFAVIGVALGVAALATVMSVTGGFRKQFRDKVLGVNAHVLILKHSTDFREYDKLMAQMKDVPGVTGIAPFVINPMMVTHDDRTATGVLLKGVDPVRVASVLDLPKHIVEGSLDGLRLPGAAPPPRRRGARFDEHQLGVEPLGFPDRKKKGSESAAAGERRSTLLKDLEQIIAEEQAEAKTSDPQSKERDAKPGSLLAPEARSPEQDTQPNAPDALDVPADSPVGSVVPEGGYESELPEQDILPDEIDPKPCSDDDGGRLLPGIVLGVGLKKHLGVGIGDCVQVTSPTIGFTFSRGAIRAPVAKEFRVIAVFDAGFDQYDSKLVYTDLYEAQAFYDYGDSVTGIEMKVSNIDETGVIVENIERRLKNGIYNVLDWEKLNHGLFTALRIQQLLMSLVLALIIVVAAFTVIATLIMVVLDKKREIAVLKAMGAKDSVLLRAFLYQGAIIGVVGAAIGLVLGALACKALMNYEFPLDPKVYFISHLPVEVRPIDFAFVGLFAIFVCLAATVWPALYAARLRPAEAFREQH